MNSVTRISSEAVPAANSMFVNVMAIACGLALVVVACMATNGVDMSVGFF